MFLASPTQSDPVVAPGIRLRSAWLTGPVVLPGVFCPLVARMAERLGFQAVYLSGAAFSAGLGLPDIGLVTASEFAEEARRITAATHLPLLCDADTGFGEALSAERTVRLYEAAGAAGLHFEDQVMPKRCGHLSGKSLVEADSMCAKLRAAVAAKRDPSFVVVARTDARGVSGYADAVDRARRYLDAGADAIFPEALETAGEFERFARDVPAPLLANLTEFGKTPPLDVKSLGDMGYKMVIFPVSAFRTALRAAERTLEAIRRDGHPRAVQPDMLSRQELYDRLGYDGYEARDKAFFGDADGRR